MGIRNKYNYGVFKWSEIKALTALQFQQKSNVVFLPDYPPLKKVSFESLLRFHRHRFGGITNPRFPPLDDWVDVLCVADIMGDEDYMEFVAQHLKIPVRTLDSSHTKDEFKKVLRDRLTVIGRL